jgi:hypothetical protein
MFIVLYDCVMNWKGIPNKKQRWSLWNNEQCSLECHGLLRMGPNDSIILTQLRTFVTWTAGREDRWDKVHEIKANANKNLLSADVLYVIYKEKQQKPCQILEFIQFL